MLRYRIYILFVLLGLIFNPVSAQSVIDLLSSEFVTLEQFGAKGDGISDDTHAFESALNTKKNIILAGKIYKISRTVTVDVNTQCIQGIAGESRIKCSDIFNGEYCIKFTNSTNGYYSRWHRVRKNGNFSIDGNKKVSGILIGDTIKKTGNAMDELYFENLYIEYTKSAMVLGNHFYKDTFVNCILRENGYSIRSCEGQYDSGESIAFYDCAFFDGGKGIDVRCGLYFYTCTFHVPIVASSCILNCFGCHFERVHGNTVVGDPMFVAKESATILINGGTAVISNNGLWTCRGAVLKADKTSSIKIVDADWNYFFRGVTTDSKEYIVEGDVDISCFKMPEKFERGINASRLKKETTENSFPRAIDQGNVMFKAYNSIGVNQTSIKYNGDGSLRVSLAANKQKNNNEVWIGKIIQIPSGKRNVWAQESVSLVRTKVENSFSLNFMTNSNNFNGLAFLDAEKNIITESDNKQFYKNVKSSKKSSSEFVYNRITSIPPNAFYILFGAAYLINDHSENFMIEFDINKYCVEFF